MLTKRLTAFIFSLMLTASATHANDLPVIANSSATISLEQEHRLGRTWARILRGSAPEYGDPMVVNYIDNLLWHLVPSSQLQDLRLQLIVLDNPTLNAFAVPGGIVGINTGLLLGAQDEQELASVIAHELAHLSQRHYAQQLELQRRNTPLMLAGILVSIIASSADPQAGAAGISSTIAAGQQSGLNFSRRNEQEADRIGMQNLVTAGYDPYAMPRMFSRIQRSYRFYGKRPPEFLLTHPVTESRIADAENRARQLEKPAYQTLKPDFQLIKKRIEVHYSQNLLQLIKSYRESADADRFSRYGLALALIKQGSIKQAKTELDQLPESLRNHLYVQLTYTELQLSAGNARQATEHLKQLTLLYPENYPVAQLYAKALSADNQFSLAAKTLSQLSRRYPDNSYIWYELAEAYGQAGNTLGVHEARTEYFLLNGQVDKALRQLDFALRDKQLSSADIARVKQRKREAEQIREEIRTLL